MLSAERVEYIPDSITVLPTEDLNGEIDVLGDKVSAVHLALATALSDRPTDVINPHYCGDVERIYDWLTSKDLAEIERGATVIRTMPQVLPELIDLSDLADTRSNICLVAPLAIKGATVRFIGTAGCGFTERRNDKHFQLLRTLGLTVVEEDGITEVSGGDAKDAVTLDCATESGISSVGVTCHALMAGMVSRREITLKNVALEAAPTTLMKYIALATNREITVHGRTVRLSAVDVLKHRETVVTLPPDVTVASTYIASLMATEGGEIVLGNFDENALPEVLRDVYQAMGLRLRRAGALSLAVVNSRQGITLPHEVYCTVWPGFPTDLAPIFAASVAGYEGEVVLTDTIYDKRSSHVPGLNAMGYNLHATGNVTTISGSQPRKAGSIAVEATDIRSGAALVVGALGSNAETVKVSNYHQIYRGYEDLIGDLQAVGANIRGV